MNSFCLVTHYEYVTSLRSASRLIGGSRLSLHVSHVPYMQLCRPGMSWNTAVIVAYKVIQFVCYEFDVAVSLIWTVTDRCRNPPVLVPRSRMALVCRMSGRKCLCQHAHSETSRAVAILSESKRFFFFSLRLVTVSRFPGKRRLLSSR